MELAREAAETCRWEEMDREITAEQARHAVPPKHHSAERGLQLWREQNKATLAALIAEEAAP
jgi:hypothetical protein